MVLLFSFVVIVTVYRSGLPHCSTYSLYHVAVAHMSIAVEFRHLSPSLSPPLYFLRQLSTSTSLRLRLSLSFSSLSQYTSLSLSLCVSVSRVSLVSLCFCICVFRSCLYLYLYFCPSLYVWLFLSYSPVLDHIINVCPPPPSCLSDNTSCTASTI